MRKLLLLALALLLVMPLSFAITLTQQEQDNILNNRLVHAIYTENCTGNIVGIQGTTSGTASYSAGSCNLNIGHVTYSNSVGRFSTGTNKTMLCYTDSNADQDDESYVVSQTNTGVTAGDVGIQVDTRSASTNLVGRFNLQSSNVEHRVSVASWFSNTSFKVVAVMVNTSGASSTYATYYNSNRLGFTTTADANPVSTQDFIVGNRVSALTDISAKYKACLYLNFSISDRQYEWIMDEFFAGNTNLTVQASTFTPAPNITSYSNGDGSCSSWTANISSPCATSETTPIIYFNTSVAAYCAIGRSNLNYTALGSFRNCTYGEGTTEHICGLIVPRAKSPRVARGR